MGLSPSPLGSGGVLVTEGRSTTRGVEQKGMSVSEDSRRRGPATIADLPEGLYEVDHAYLVDPSHRRLELRSATFEIYADARGGKHLRGRSLVTNVAFVDILEDAETVDLVLSFFGDYFLWLEAPVIQAGKMFTPETESSLIFREGRKTSFVTREQFEELAGLGQASGVARPDSKG